MRTCEFTFITTWKKINGTIDWNPKIKPNFLNEFHMNLQIKEAFGRSTCFSFFFKKKVSLSKNNNYEEKISKTENNKIQILRITF